MAPANLQEILDRPDPVELLRNSQLGAYVYPVVAAEFTNWRREQWAWQRHRGAVRPVAPHGQPLHRGPGRAQAALRHGDQRVGELPGRTRPSSTSRRRRTATSSATASSSTSPRKSSSTSAARPPPTGCSSTAETGGYDVEIVNDDRSPSRPMGKPVNREYWRFQIQGPNAWAVIEKLNGGPLEQLKFFNMSEMNDRRARRCARCATAWPARRASRSGVRTTSTTRSARRSSRPGKEFGIEPGGSRAYSSNTLESGWIPSPLPGDLHRRGAARLPRVARRRQLRGDQRDRRLLRLGRHRGLLPQPVGARLRLVRQVRPRLHRPRGAGADRPRRAAQEGHAGVERRGHGEDPRLDVRPRGRAYKFFDLPHANYGSSNYDSVIDADGNAVGLSLFTGYTRNEKHGAVAGDRSTARSRSAPRCTSCGASRTAAPRRPRSSRTSRSRCARSSARCPYAEVARETYAEGRRTKGVVI